MAPYLPSTSTAHATPVGFQSAVHGAAVTASSSVNNGKPLKLKHFSKISRAIQNEHCASTSGGVDLQRQIRDIIQNYGGQPGTATNSSLERDPSRSRGQRRLEIEENVARAGSGATAQGETGTSTKQVGKQLRKYGGAVSREMA